MRLETWMPFAIAIAIAIPSAAIAAEALTLVEALAGAPVVRSARAAGTRAEAADAAVVVANGAWDPELGVRVEGSGASTAGFIAGFPTESTARGMQSSIEVSGALPTSTTWSVQTSLDYDSSTTLATLAGVETEQVRMNWSGLVSLSVSQDLLAPLRRSDANIAVRQAREAADVASLQRDQALEAAVERVAQEWWAWSAAHRQAKTAARTLEDAERLVATTRVLQEEGRVARLEVSRVEADRLQAQRALLTAQAEARQAGQTLFATLERPLDSDLVPMGRGDIASGELVAADAEVLALSADLDVAVARAGVQAEQAALRDARAVGLPSLDLGGAVGVASLDEDAGSALRALASDPLPRWSLGLEVGVALGGRAARGTIASSKASLALAELELADAEDQTRLAVRAALDDLMVARASVQLATAQLDVAQQTEDGEQARLDEGLTRLDDLLAARSDRVDAETELIDAEAERARAELSLLRRVGRLHELGTL